MWVNGCWQLAGMLAPMSRAASCGISTKGGVFVAVFAHDAGILLWAARSPSKSCELLRSGDGEGTGSERVLEREGGPLQRS